jgi:quercetin dioxygenase-like cupin family protein
VKIAEVLGLHLDNLLQTSTNEKPYAIHRRADDVWFDLVDFASSPLPEKAQNSVEERVNLSKEKRVSPLNILQSRLEYGRIKPTIIEVSSPSPARSHSGEEHVFVLSGSAIISVGSDSIQLEEGESLTFWSAELHSYAPAEGSSLPVRLLSVRVDT